MTTPPPHLTRCEAATALGERCQGNVAHIVDLGDRGRHGLCGAHGRAARGLGVTLWRPGLDPPPKRFYTRVGPWTAEDDAYLLARPDVRLKDIAAHLGRTVEAVRNRRHLLKHRQTR